MSFSLVVEKIDQVAIKGCERFSHWFQKLTGKTNFFIAKVGISLFIFSLILRVLSYFFPSMFVAKTDVLMAVTSAVCAIWACSELAFLEEADKLVNSDSESIAKPAFLISTSNFLRVYCLIGSFITFILFILFIFISKTKREMIPDIFIYLVMVLGFTIYIYFIEVNPLRPSKSKIKEFVEKYSFGFLKPFCEKI